MALQKIHDFDPGYKEVFSGDEIKGKSVYSEGTDEKIGTVNDTLVDENGQFRYLVVDVGSWFSGKKVLLPVGRSRIDSQIDSQSQRVYAMGMSKVQAEQLPKFNENEVVDHDL